MKDFFIIIKHLTQHYKLLIFKLNEVKILLTYKLSVRKAKKKLSKRSLNNADIYLKLFIFINYVCYEVFY